MIVFLFVLWGASCSDSNSNELQFDTRQWKAGDFRHRGQMAKSLREHSILMGKTKEEVRQLLGDPQKEEVGYLSYKLDLGSAFERLFPYSSYYILIEIDEKSGVAKKVSIVDA